MNTSPADSAPLSDAENLAKSVLATAARAKAFSDARRMPAALLQVLTIAEHETEMDPVSYACSWMLYSFEVNAALPNGTDEEKRAYAIAWLRRHAEGLRTILRSFGQRAVLVKDNENGRYGVSATIRSDEGGYIMPIGVYVDDALTCDLEPTGEIEAVPAVPAVPAIPATTRPVMRKVCPPSIFQSVADDRADPEPEATTADHGVDAF